MNLTQTAATVRLPASQTRACRRCGGSGTVAHKHVLGGVCFGCGGKGHVRKVERAPVDRTITSLTVWPSGMAHASIVAAGCGVREYGSGEVTYGVPTSVLRDHGVSAEAVARLNCDCDTAEALETSRAIITAAERYGFHAV